MTELSATQREILAYALEHTEGKVVWFPPHLKGSARDKVLDALFARGLITPVGDLWLVGSNARAALGLDQPQDPPSPKIADEQALPSPAARPKRQAVTTARILALLKEGATIRDLAAATGWQAHSLRALLCHALPRQGYRILAEKTPGCRQKRYRLAASEPIARDPKEAAHD